MEFQVSDLIVVERVGGPRMIAVDTLNDLHARWEAGTLTARDRDRLIALSEAVKA